MAVPFGYVHGPELYSPYPGESENRLRRKFADLREAVLLRAATVAAMSEGEGTTYGLEVSLTGLLFIDELDALCPARTDRTKLHRPFIFYAP